jgi:hypothetical protein
MGYNFPHKKRPPKSEKPFVDAIVSVVLLAFENGERGIRTLVTVTRKQHFQCCAFNHSAISPGDLILDVAKS